MRVYHFTNLEFGLDDLRRRRLKVATINDLNDPFELIGPASSNRDIRAVFEMFKRATAVYFGLICFSRNWTNPVQWSHYADGHRGVCFGFDVPDARLYRVRYTNRRPALNLGALSGGGAAAMVEFKRMLTTKYSHWRYEDEERYFVSLSHLRPRAGLYFLPFSKRMPLKEVIVGHRCELTRNELYSHLGVITPHAETYKARLAFRSFKVVRQRNPKLWS